MAKGPEKEHEARGSELAEEVEAIQRALGLAELGTSTVEALVGLAQLTSEWNQRMNLTGHKSAEEVVGGLIAEAMALSEQLPSEATSFTDLGSGAGFPGLPLAILRPQAAFVLVEARERRVHFQRAAVRRLQLKNVTTLIGRAERLDPHPSQVVTAQAVGTPEVVLELARPWAEPGGLLAIPSSERVAGEAQGRSTWNGVEASTTRELQDEPARPTWEFRPYRVPGRSDPRVLLLHRFPLA